MQLITIDKDDVTYRFPDLFLFDKNLGHNGIVIELKLFNLIGLYSGNLNKN